MILGGPWQLLKSLKNYCLLCFDQLAWLGETLGAFSGSLVDPGESVWFLPVHGRRFGDIRGALGQASCVIEGPCGRLWDILGRFWDRRGGAGQSLKDLMVKY